MSKKEFKKKYLIDAFFWINKANYKLIQKILNEFDIPIHTGEGIIEWHNGFNNIVTFGEGYYQKADMWLPNARYGEAKNIKEMLVEYKKLRGGGV